MLRSLIAATVIVVATLAASSAMAHEPYRGGCYPSYRSYPSYRHYQRSEFRYRNPYQWDAYNNYLRHQSRHYRSYSPYRGYSPYGYNYSPYGVGVYGRHFSLQLGF